MVSVQNKISSIGLEIDAHEFRAVQLMSGPKGTKTLAWAVFPRLGNDDVAARKSLPNADELRWASSILGRRGFVGRTVSISPSTAECTSHIMELPPVDSGAPIEQLARMEVARANKCAPNEFELGYWSLPAKGRTAETLAVACPRPIIDCLIEQFSQAGMTPVGIDLMELAICRGGQTELVEDDKEINASLHIGWASSLAVLTLGNTVMYVRRIERGASSVWDLATGRYKLSPRSADSVIDDSHQQSLDDVAANMRKSAWSGLAFELANELDVAIAYVSNSYRFAPFGKIRLSGYGTSNSVIEEQLDKVLGIPVSNTPPVALVEAIGAGRDSWSMACRLAVPYGLAARFDR